MNDRVIRMEEFERALQALAADRRQPLSDEDRLAHGITRPAFGDLIYHTPEGTQIVPSFWGPKPSAGMHGHHPRHPGQHGVCLANRDLLPGDEMTANDFYVVASAALDA